MKFLSIVLIPILPLLVHSQTMVMSDSAIIQLGNNTTIRKVVNVNYVTPSAGYKILVRDSATKKKGLLSASVLFDGNYNSLTNKPTIPTNTNQLTNGALFLIASDITGKLNKTDTGAMLLHYLNAINGKQAALGFTPYNATNPSGYISANQTITLSGDISGSGTTGIVTTIGASKVTNAMLAGSIDLATKVTGLLPFANTGGVTATTSATTGTISVSMVTPIITCVPSGALTLNATGGVTGQRTTFVFTTSGASSFNITFNTNFKSIGVLATGTTTAKIFTITFLCTNGTQWVEQGRTAGQ